MEENKIKVFSNDEFGNVRVVDKDGEPYFVGKDVAEILGYSNSRKVLADHVDEEDKGVTKCDTPSGKQTMTIINEVREFKQGIKTVSAKDIAFIKALIDMLFCLYEK